MKKRYILVVASVSLAMGLGIAQAKAPLCRGGNMIASLAGACGKSTKNDCSCPGIQQCKETSKGSGQWRCESP